MELEQELKKALEELRKTEPRKFDQTADLIVNLQKFNIKKDNVNTFVTLPHTIKKKKIAAFLEVENKDVDTITPDDFKKYSDKKMVKKLVDKYDFFIGQASLMPKVATVFGRALGPSGKMPSPQLGILANPDEKSIIALKEKINNSTKIKIKEASVKLAIGKQKMKDEEIAENILSVYNALLKVLINGKDNIKHLKAKFTMIK